MGRTMIFNFKGNVEYLADLNNISAKYGDCYHVTYSGGKDDPPKSIKRIDSVYTFLQCWVNITEVNSDIKEWWLFSTDKYVVSLEINNFQGNLKIANIYPSIFDNPKTKLNMLSDILIDMKSVKINVSHTLDEALTNFYQEVSKFKVINCTKSLGWKDSFISSGIDPLP